MKLNKQFRPYVIGSLIGAMSVVVYMVFDRLPGVSGACLQVANGLTMVFTHAIAKPLSWFPLGFMGAVMIGSFLSAWFFNDWQKERVPSVWVRAFGPSFLKRSIFAFLGGIIAMIGAHISDGCTVGKAISLGMQLDLSAWVFVGALFIGGMGSSFLLYRPWRWGRQS